MLLVLLNLSGAFFQPTTECIESGRGIPNFLPKVYILYGILCHEAWWPRWIIGRLTALGYAFKLVFFYRGSAGTPLAWACFLVSRTHCTELRDVPWMAMHTSPLYRVKGLSMDVAFPSEIQWMLFSQPTNDCIDSLAALHRVQRVVQLISSRLRGLGAIMVVCILHWKYRTSLRFFYFGSSDGTPLAVACFLVSSQVLP